MIKVMRASEEWFGYTAEGCVMERGPNSRGWNAHRISKIKRGDVCLALGETSYQYYPASPRRRRGGNEVVILGPNGTICVIANVDAKTFGSELV